MKNLLHALLVFQKNTIMKQLVKISLVVVVSSPVFGQKKVGGFIVNIQNEPISYATVSEILPVSEQRYWGTVLSDSLGRFDITVQDMESSIYVTYIGCVPQKVPLNIAQPSSLRIVMLPDSNMVLDEVIVTAQKRAVTLGEDRLIYDMSANPLKNNHTLQSLRFVPLVLADENSFSIMGKDETVVYINDRKTNMDPSTLLIYLKSLPTENVSSIEIITAPGSTFIGEGNFGVINFKIKGNENEGLKGNISGQLWKTHYLKESGNFNLNYAQYKWFANLSAGIGNYSTWKEMKVENNYLHNPLITQKESTYENREAEYYANLQTDYQLSNRSIIGLVINTSFAHSQGDETGLTSFGRGSFAVVDSLIDVNIRRKGSIYSFAVNANYRFNAEDHKQHFTIDLDYLDNRNKQFSNNRMNKIQVDGSLQYPYLNYEEDVPQIVDIFSGKIEYGNHIGRLNLTLGLDSYYSSIHNDDRYSTWNSRQYVKDTLRSNEFEVHEFTTAAFMQANSNWSPALSISLGTRLEYTNYEGFQHTTMENFTNNFFKILPSFNINYNLMQNHNINYNVSYRMSRHSFRYLNPFVQYTSPVSYSNGNPFLKPSGNFYQYFRYALKNKYFLSASYNISDNPLTPIQLIKENYVVENTILNMGNIYTFRTWFKDTSINNISKYFCRIKKKYYLCQKK